MPELPEVETTRRGVAPWLDGRQIQALEVRNPRLRWPIPRSLPARLAGARIHGLDRRGKYMLLRSDQGVALIHLGMTGTLRLVFDRSPPKKHDHYDIILDQGPIVRFQDPRRFGCLLWAGQHPDRHALLRELGPEPLEPEFDGEYLYRASQGRKVAIKSHLMNARTVVGVGNIYASEALFRARIHPRRPAGRISMQRMERLATAVKAVLEDAIRAGGTTLRDFYDGEGKPGYFTQELQMYDRAGLPCPACGSPVRHEVLGQRSTYYCVRCQT